MLLPRPTCITRTAAAREVCTRPAKRHGTLHLMCHLLLPPNVDSVLHIAEQKARITDKGRTGVSPSGGINMHARPTHRVTVGKTIARALRKTRRLLLLRNRNAVSVQPTKVFVPHKDLRHRPRHLPLARGADSRAAPLQAQKIKADMAHIAEVVCHLDDA